MMQEKMIAALRQTFLFQDLSDEDLEKVARRAKIREFFTNETIVYQGEPSTSLYLVTNGIVAVKSLDNGKENLLAYLMPGNVFGEVGILENDVRSASVVAVSEVDVLVLQRDDFLEILHQHPKVAIQLARILGRYLVHTSRRVAKEHRKNKLILVFNVDEHIGGTTFATLLADKFYEMLKTPTAYLEYPNSWRLVSNANVPKGAQIFHHPDGYDILLPQEESFLPESTRATILLDRMRNNYENVVIHTNDNMDDATRSFLEHADQIVIMTSPTRQGQLRAENLQKALRGKIRPEETSVITIISRSRPEFAKMEVPPMADFDIPYFPDGFPAFSLKARDTRDLPNELEEILRTCIERLDRTNSIGIFIPTTTDVDQSSDTTAYMDQTMSFMAERFGGATCKIANGVWHSEKLGLVGEVVYIVHSYITQSDMNLYLDEVVDYIKGLKRELKQEAMALEVNHKLTLI
ncbi:MAG: cyclic nucleotide-binding domain-containing protein [Bacteroidota bacterium]